MANIPFLASIERFLAMALAVCFCCSVSGSWICLILLLVVALAQSDRLDRLKVMVQAPFLPPLCLFAVPVLISGLACGGIDEGIKAIWSMRGLVVPYLTAFQLFRKTDNAAWTLTILLLAGAVSGLFAVPQQIFHFHPFTTYPFLQATGFLSEPMSFAGVIQLTSFLGLGFLIKKGYRRLPLLGNDKIFVAVLLANFLGLLFCGERSAWVGMIFAFLSICLYVSPKMLLRGAIVLLVVGTLSYCFVPLVKARIAPMAHWQSDVSITARLKIWSTAWKLFEDHPITGVGPRNFPRLPMPEAVVAGRSTDLNHAHSNYLQILSTTGILGLAAFLYLLGSALYLSYRQSKQEDNETSNWQGMNSAIGLGLLGALISLSFAGIFEYNFNSGHIKLVQWVLLSLLVTTAKLKPPSRALTDSARQSEVLE